MLTLHEMSTNTQISAIFSTEHVDVTILKNMSVFETQF